MDEATTPNGQTPASFTPQPKGIMTPTSTILFVFLVQLSLSIISTIGAQKVNDIAWWFFTLIFTSSGKNDKEARKLRSEVVRLSREMKATSAQDNFAKWARLRREHDKAKEAYDKMTRNSSSTRSSFDSIFSKLRWLGTQGINFIVNSTFSKQAMFWLPKGWLPHSAEWVLSLPRAPLGSISVNVWALACGAVIAMITEGVAALWALRSKAADSSKGQMQKEKIAMPGNGLGQEKKEL
ncbi:unnamed protein product [Zymoseptoria tritici ST99CH_1A5]|uniref:Uncharacterized protein n=4 Tax=Zymoseptoria tritici TaxID=1047171 RepID=A0A1X7S8B1_ZYMT9|nr:unnamed protein product [Zymoseptoria tritici ST99CH_3D7]SMR60843.1 unnamed protein product [Zymoseptoria tritici ST99CH_1E4]SMR63984.1 unnamed protein product [Zymoseptoria tritici ST99CH_3D1]SMY29337.1 unnamed protein product [Zymoseptoria tritici ST99CH_1A5]